MNIGPLVDAGLVSTTQLLSPGAAIIGYQPPGSGSVATTVAAKLGEWISVLDKGADPTGAASSQPAFQTVLNIPAAGKSIFCRVPAGTYNLPGSPTVGSGTVYWLIDPGVTFTGAGTVPYAMPVRFGGAQLGTGINNTQTQYGGVLKIIAPGNTSGDATVKISDFTFGDVPAGTDSVLLSITANSSATIPREWCLNAQMAKGTTGGTNTAIVVEATVINQGSEANNPNAAGGVLIPFWASCIGGLSSAAFAITGSAADATHGFKNGLWIDAVQTGGLGIAIRNFVGTNSMASAFDTEGYSGTFSNGAMTFANNHPLTWLDTTAGRHTILNLENTGNFVVLGYNGGGGLAIQSQQIFLQNYTTQTTATAGTQTLPANPVGFITVGIAGTNRKIPFYAV